MMPILTLFSMRLIAIIICRSTSFSMTPSLVAQIKEKKK